MSGGGPAVDVDAILRRNALVGTCARCHWETELRTVGELERVMKCPTCGTPVTLTRRQS